MEWFRVVAIHRVGVDPTRFLRLVDAGPVVHAVSRGGNVYGVVDGVSVEALEALFCNLIRFEPTSIDFGGVRLFRFASLSLDLGSIVAPRGCAVLYLVARLGAGDRGCRL